jgi:hypothetical protein
MKVSIFAFYVACFIGFCAFNKIHTHAKVLVIQQCPSDFKAVSGDTIFMQYCYGITMINDSVIKRCGADTANIRTIFITNPGNFIQDMYFGRFTNLRHLILAGDDTSELDSIHYDFFSNKTLKRITISSVYMTEGREGRKGMREVRKFIHRERSDIKVSIRNMGVYNNIDGF